MQALRNLKDIFALTLLYVGMRLLSDDQFDKVMEQALDTYRSG